MTDPINEFKTATGKYPSNVQVWHVGKDADGEFSPTLLNKIFFGNTPAPKGHVIIDAFTQNRSYMTGIGGLPAGVVNETRPSTVAFYAGRAWYSGALNSPLASTVFFSQVLQNPYSAGKCYQEQDPTSEEFNELLATDGGVIKIPEAGSIHKLVAVSYGVVVLASNGCWEISGGSSGFSADNYQVNKITSAGCKYSRSVVIAEDIVVYWGDSGIYVISYDTESRSLLSRNISDEKIKSLYDTIAVPARAYVKAGYDKKAKKLLWLCSLDPEYDGTSDRFKYTTIIIYDLVTTAFTTYSLATTPNYVVGLTATPSSVLSVTEAQVIDSDGDTIIDTLSNSVVASINFNISSPFLTKFTTVVPNNTIANFTLSDLSSNTFTDWGTYYNSYIETHDESVGDLLRNKDVPYVFTYFNRTETSYELVDNELTLANQSSCLLSAKWGWTGSAASGKWTSAQQAYRLKRVYVPSGVGDTFDYGEDVIWTKLKIRGSGKAIRFRWDSENGKDFQMLGYAFPISTYEAI